MTCRPFTRRSITSWLASPEQGSPPVSRCSSVRRVVVSRYDARSRNLAASPELRILLSVVRGRSWDLRSGEMNAGRWAAASISVVRSASTRRSPHRSSSSLVTAARGVHGRLFVAPDQGGPASLSAAARTSPTEEAGGCSRRPTFTVDVALPAQPVRSRRRSDALRGMGLRVTERDGLVVAASRPWAVFGSPVFHWALLLLIVVILGGRLTRAEGLMGVPGGRFSDRWPPSRSACSTSGGLYRFSATPDGFASTRWTSSTWLTESTGAGANRFDLRPDGSVAASQVVYPNNPMRYGSLTIHPGASACRRDSRSCRGRGARGPEPTSSWTSPRRSRRHTTRRVHACRRRSRESIVASVTVPLAKRDGAFVRRRAQPATGYVHAATGRWRPPVASGTLSVGEELQLPDGSRLRLLGVGYYARLSVVDDPSIPLVYALLLVGASRGERLDPRSAESRGRGDRSRARRAAVRVDVWFRDWRSNAVRRAGRGGRAGGVGRQHRAGMETPSEHRDTPDVGRGHRVRARHDRVRLRGRFRGREGPDGGPVGGLAGTGTPGAPRSGSAGSRSATGPTSASTRSSARTRSPR